MVSKIIEIMNLIKWLYFTVCHAQYTPQEVHPVQQIETSGLRWETSGCTRNPLFAKRDLMKFFVSPNFPMKFTDGATCTWKIKAGPNYKIQIMWTEFWMDQCGKNQVTVFDRKAKKKYGPYCGMKKPPKLTLGNEVEVTMKKHTTPHPTAGRGVVFMMGYQAFLKGSAPPKAPPGMEGRGSSAPKRPKKPKTGVVAGSSGVVSVGHIKVDKLSGTISYQKPKIQLKKASGPAAGPNAGPQGPAGKNGSSGGMVNGKCMDPPGMVLKCTKL